MSTIGKKRRYPTASSPNQSDDDNGGIYIDEYLNDYLINSR
jgi:hypothetical protein